jgi:hypothetical protein
MGRNWVWDSSVIWEHHGAYRKGSTRKHRAVFTTLPTRQTLTLSGCHDFDNDDSGPTDSSAQESASRQAVPSQWSTWHWEPLGYSETTFTSRSTLKRRISPLVILAYLK